MKKPKDDLKNSWNLGLLYKSEKDPQIEKDLKIIEKSYSDFEKKYKKIDFISTPSKLLNAFLSTRPPRSS